MQGCSAVVNPSLGAGSDCDQCRRIGSIRVPGRPMQRRDAILDSCHGVGPGRHCSGRTTSGLVFVAARYRGVMPFWARAMGSAPAASSARTTSGLCAPDRPMQDRDFQTLSRAIGVGTGRQQQLGSPPDSRCARPPRCRGVDFSPNPAPLGSAPVASSNSDHRRITIVPGRPNAGAWFSDHMLREFGSAPAASSNSDHRRILVVLGRPMQDRRLFPISRSIGVGSGLKASFHALDRCRPEIRSSVFDCRQVAIWHARGRLRRPGSASRSRRLPLSDRQPYHRSPVRIPTGVSDRRLRSAVVVQVEATCGAFLPSIASCALFINSRAST